MLVDKEPQVLLNLLVDPFCLTVHLGVISCGGSNLGAKELIQFMHKVRDKLETMVTDHFLW